MRKNILMLLTGCLAAMTVSASNIHNNTDSIYKQNTFSQVWGIERSGFFNGREKWAKGFENQRV